MTAFDPLGNPNTNEHLNLEIAALREKLKDVTQLPKYVVGGYSPETQAQSLPPPVGFAQAEIARLSFKLGYLRAALENLSEATHMETCMADFEARFKELINYIGEA